MTRQKLNRRNFLQLAVTGVALFFVYLWDKMTGKAMLTAVRKKIVLPVTRKQIAFYGDYIVVNRHREIKVFSAHCTHLGCIINQEQNGRLICPCHGSEFNLDGMAVKGPAYKPLQEIPFKLNREKQEIIIQSAVS